MQYLLLIYSNEKDWEKLSKEEEGRILGEYGAFTESIAKSGHYKAGEALEPTSTATTVRVRDGKTTDHRRPLCRDQGAARRLLPDRGQGPRRGRGDRRAGAGRTARLHRGAADHAHALSGARRDGRERSTARSADRVLATLIRLLGDFDRAEEALQDAFARALESWPRAGVPENPRAWLVTVGPQPRPRPAAPRARCTARSSRSWRCPAGRASAGPSSDRGRASKTIGSASSSPAAIPRCAPRRRSP